MDRSIEGQLALVHPSQDLNRFLDDEVAFQQLISKSAASDFDLLGQRDFLLTREQWDFTHLRQVHANGIVRPRFPVVGQGQQDVFFFGRLPGLVSTLLMMLYAVLSLTLGFIVFDRLRDSLAEAI